MRKFLSSLCLPVWLVENPLQSTLDNEREWLEEETFYGTYTGQIMSMSRKVYEK